MRKSVVTVLCIIMASLLVCLGAAWYIFGVVLRAPDLEPENPEIEIVPTFCAGISVDGIDISGMTLEEASSALHKLHVASDETFKLELQLEDYTDTIEYPDITVSYNTNEILNEAIQFGNNGTEEQRLEERERAAAEGVSYISAKSYSIDDISAVLTNIAERAYIEPQDATSRFEINAWERFVYTDGIPGRAADIGALEAELNLRMEQKRFGEPITVPVTVLEPLVTTEQLRKKNVMISSYSTSFEGRSLGGENRVHNINKVVEAINGYNVMPGEIIDINAILGPRTNELGWPDAGGSADGQDGAQAGGGAGQGVSTLYNAVMMADLEITERAAHAWPVDYVPIGRDAAINADGANLCFSNDRESPIYIVAYCDVGAKTITCEIWGEPLPDGITILIDSEKTESLTRLSTKTQIDPSLGAGKRRVERQGRTGAIAATYKEYYDRDGNLIERELYESSTYPSIQGVVYVSAVLSEEEQLAQMPVNTPILFPGTRQ